MREGTKREVLDEKCLALCTAKGWNFTWDGQAGLGHPGRRPAMRWSAKAEGVLEGALRLDSLDERCE